MTGWQAIIQRAAYTRFCKTGSLDPFRLVMADLLALAREVSGMPIQPPGDGVLRIQIRVPVPSIHDGVMVLVDEWT